MSDGERAHDRPTALDPPMVPLAVAGIIVWAVAGLALLPFRDTLAAHGHGDWLAICLAGFLWGFPGLAVMIRHDANRRRRRTAPAPAPAPTPTPTPTPVGSAETAAAAADEPKPASHRTD